MQPGDILISTIDRPIGIVTRYQVMGQNVEEKTMGQLPPEKSQGLKEHTDLEMASVS